MRLWDLLRLFQISEFKVCLVNGLKYCINNEAIPARTSGIVVSVRMKGMKIKKALGVISDKFKEPDVCESCGDEFTCGISLKGCWCMNVELNDDQRADIKTRFDKCLCPKCLEIASKS
jgi:hypothetical protein